MVLELKALYLKMMTCLLLVIWMMHLLHLRGVFGDEVKRVSVKEGDSVTLHTDVTQIQKYTDIEWTFGGDIITKVNITTQQISYNYNAGERFRDRLQLDLQTGSLTITNTRTTDSGDYMLQMYRKYLKKTFRVTIYAPLSRPVITSNCSSSSSQQNCSLLCSAVNVSDVTLSWYKGNSLLSSISVSDLSISLSLPLEVEYLEKNSYSCVINNPVSTQTTHLDISQLCHTCSAPYLGTDGWLIIAGATVIFLIVTANVIFCIYRKHKKAGQQVQTREEEITYADPTFIKQKVRKARIQKDDDVVYAGVAVSH